MSLKGVRFQIVKKSEFKFGFKCYVAFKLHNLVVTTARYALEHGGGGSVQS